MTELCQQRYVFSMPSMILKTIRTEELHCHIMLTGIDEQGKWMPKQKKVYQRENGERIPAIEKDGQQKVDKQNRKQWKCTTIQTND